MKREWWIAKYNWHGHYRSDRWRFAYEEDELHKIIENDEAHIHVISADYCESLERQIEDLKMVCRRMAAAKKLSTKDKIAEQCYHLFAGSILRKERESGEL